jgi:sortase A
MEYRRRDPRLASAEWVLLAVGAVFLSAAVMTWIDAAVYQERAGRELTLSDPAASAVALRGRLAEGKPLGRMQVARIGLDAVIAEGVDDLTLRRAIGHVPDSALPGEPGNVVLAGHRDTFFRPLRNVTVGDTIRVATSYATFDYIVTSHQVTSPDDVDAVVPTREPTLTLITCYPFRYAGSAPQRFIVRAKEVRSRARRRAPVGSIRARTQERPEGGGGDVDEDVDTAVARRPDRDRLRGKRV